MCFYFSQSFILHLPFFFLLKFFMFSLFSFCYIYILFFYYLRSSIFLFVFKSFLFLPSCSALTWRQNILKEVLRLQILVKLTHHMKAPTLHSANQILTFLTSSYCSVIFFILVYLFPSFILVLSFLLIFFYFLSQWEHFHLLSLHNWFFLFHTLYWF